MYFSHLVKMIKASKQNNTFSFFFFFMKNDIQAAKDGTQSLEEEIARECLAALKCVQVQMHYIKTIKTICSCYRSCQCPGKKKSKTMGKLPENQS